MEEYIYKNGKKLKYGYTTGSCAAAAAKAAATMLLTNSKLEKVSILTPKGIILNLDVLEILIGREVSCAIKKDSGDDPDITNGIMVYAKVKKSHKKGVNILGGLGVGRVTKKGLEQPIGEAAINKVPRKMIENEVLSVIDDLDYPFGLDVEISIPEGVEVAKKTFNGRLGIEGGISILGTTGIVEPMSEKALTDSIRLEMKVLYENGKEYISVTPGNYGEAFAKSTFNVNIEDSVKCSNYIGEALDYAEEFKFKGLLLIGHIGKLVKLAGGVMNTHSKYADCRMEIISCYAALEGASRDTLNRLINAITTDEAIDILEETMLKDKVMKRLIDRISFHVNSRVHNEVKVEVMVFSNQHGLLCETGGSRELLSYFTI